MKRLGDLVVDLAIGAFKLVVIIFIIFQPEVKGEKYENRALPSLFRR